MGADQGKPSSQAGSQAATASTRGTVTKPRYDGTCNPAVFVPRAHKPHDLYKKTLKGRAEQLAMGADPDAMPPSVMATEPEWDSMMEELLTTHPCVIKTVILPEGVTLDDPRLAEAEEVCRYSYTLPLGQMPELPKGPCESQIAGSLVTDEMGPTRGRTTHYQILPEELLERSEFLAYEKEGGTPNRW